MLYVIYFIAAYLQNAVFSALTGTAAGWQTSGNKLLTGTALTLCAAAQFVLVVPPTLFHPAARFGILLLLMLLKAAGYALIFRTVRLKMLYLSVLSFVINSNYSNILLLFTKEALPVNILACAAEAVICTAILLYIRKKRNAALIAGSLKQISAKLLAGILVFLYFMSFFEFTIVEERFNSVSRYMTLPVILISTFLIARIMKTSASARENEQISKLLSEQLENQVEHYQKINAVYSEFRSFRHDFRNHLLCLRSLLAENEVQRACEYMDEIECMSHSRRKTFDTGNIIIDALLNDKSEKAAQVQAQITFSGYSPTVGITSADLCTVFANAIDNAIEACAKDESDTEKQIEIRSDFQQGFYQLRITNPVFEKVEIRNGNQIRTSKEDASLHGFGVANIVRTAQKYGGDAVMTAENGLFALEVSLWLKQEA